MIQVVSKRMARTFRLYAARRHGHAGTRRRRRRGFAVRNADRFDQGNQSIIIVHLLVTLVMLVAQYEPMYCLSDRSNIYTPTAAALIGEAVLSSPSATMSAHVGVPAAIVDFVEAVRLELSNSRPADLAKTIESLSRHSVDLR